jgi:hypothetical protein
LLNVSHVNGYGRYLDNTNISGTLDVTQLIASGFVRDKSANRSHGLSTLSMMNNHITDVLYKGSVEDIATVFR